MPFYPFETDYVTIPYASAPPDGGSRLLPNGDTASAGVDGKVLKTVFRAKEVTANASDMLDAAEIAEVATITDEGTKRQPIPTSVKVMKEELAPSNGRVIAWLSSQKYVEDEYKDTMDKFRSSLGGSTPWLTPFKESKPEVKSSLKILRPNKERNNKPFDVLADVSELMLTSASESRSSKHQILNTFEDAKLYMSGESPRIWNFNGVVYNLQNKDWYSNLEEKYDSILNGTATIRQGARAYLRYANKIVEGVILQLSTSLQEMDQAASFAFSMFVISVQRIQFSGNANIYNGHRAETIGGLSYQDEKTQTSDIVTSATFYTGDRDIVEHAMDAVAEQWSKEISNMVNSGILGPAGHGVIGYGEDELSAVPQLGEMEGPYYESEPLDPETTARSSSASNKTPEEQQAYDDWYFGTIATSTFV